MQMRILLGGNAMAAPRENPLYELIRTAEESARVMWQRYDQHLGEPLRGKAWEEQSWKLFELCMQADMRVWRLKQRRILESQREQQDDGGSSI
jgi:hypothetical protein